MRAVLDSNILIDYLNGVAAATEEIGRYHSPMISRISWMEVMTGALEKKSEPAVRAFLGSFSICEIDQATAEAAIRCRKQLRLRLPDAIILATARVQGALLVTRNTKDFDPAWPEVREPYCV